MLRRYRWLLPLALILFAFGCAPRPAADTSANPPSQEDRATSSSSNQDIAIAWSYDYQDALAQARQENKPLMVDVFATWCQPCKMLDEQVFSRADVAEASRDFIPVKVDGDKHPDTKDQLGVTGYPTVLFLSPDGREITRTVGQVPYQVMLNAMKQARAEVGSPQP